MLVVFGLLYLVASSLDPRFTELALMLERAFRIGRASSSTVCAPKSGQSLQAGLEWAECCSGVDVTPPTTCTSQVERAAYAFSKYLVYKQSAGGSCDFGGAASLQSTSSLDYPEVSHCIYGASPSPPGPSPPSGNVARIKVMSYNLFGWNALDQSAPTLAPLLFQAINDVDPDVLGAQEIVNEDWVASSTNMAVAPGAQHGVAILYKESVLQVIDNGVVYLNERDTWGQRVSVWAKFRHKATGVEFHHFNTHFCLCSDTQLMGSAASIADVIASEAGSNNCLFTGDLNTPNPREPPYPESVRYLMGMKSGSPVQMRDVLGEMGATSETFPNQGRIDWMLAQGNVEFNEAHVGPKGGSDHHNIYADITFQ